MTEMMSRLLDMLGKTKSLKEMLKLVCIGVVDVINMNVKIAGDDDFRWMKQIFLNQILKLP